MSNSEQSDGNRNAFPFSTGQTLALILGAVAVVYFSASLTLYLSVSPQERGLTTLLFPFETGPSAQNLHEKGVEAFRSGRYEQAVGYFSRSLQKKSNNTKGFFLLASAWAKQGNFKKAIESLRPLDGKDVDLPRLHARKSYWQLGRGQYDQARESARRFVEEPSVPATNRLYGHLVLYFAELLPGDEASARTVLEEARSLTLPEGSWAGTLLESLVTENPPQNMNRGERTEFRAWRALLHVAEGGLDEAREDREWVLKAGVQSRYEHDLMLATKASGLF